MRNKLILVLVAAAAACDGKGTLTHHTGAISLPSILSGVTQDPVAAVSARL